MDNINLKIKTPFLQLEVKGNQKNITEVRRLFLEINKLSMVDLDLNIDELMPSSTLPFWKFSKDIQKNTKIMDLINQISQIEDGLIIRKESIDNISEISEEGTTYKINLLDTKKTVKKIFNQIDISKTNFVLIHVTGKISDDCFEIVFDQIKKEIPNSKTEVMKTKKDILGKTIIECLFFGNYPDEE